MVLNSLGWSIIGGHEMELLRGTDYSLQEARCPRTFCSSFIPQIWSMQKVKELGSRARKSLVLKTPLLVVMAAGANLLEPVTPNRTWEKTLYLWRSSARNSVVGRSVPHVDHHIGLSLRYHHSPRRTFCCGPVALAFVRKNSNFAGGA